MKSLALLCAGYMLLISAVVYGADGDLIAVDNNGSEYFRVEGSDGTVTITGNIEVSTDNSFDLGASGAEFKDLYIDGTAYLDAVTIADRAAVLAISTTQQVVYSDLDAATSGNVTVTFPTAFSAAPVCVATMNVAGDVYISSDATTTSVTFSTSANGTETISYVCVGAK